MRILINGIAFVLPRAAKLSKEQIFTSYGKGTHFEKSRAACDKIHEDIQAANDKRKADNKEEKELAPVGETPKKEAKKPKKKKTQSN